MNDASRASMLPLALDAMGGDLAPLAVVFGAARALKKNPDLRFLFVGDENALRPLLSKRPQLLPVSEILHTTEQVAATDMPSVALRKATKSSMRLAIDAVKEGRASGVVSSGNTGAFMAMAKLVFRTLPGISRPAIIGMMPNKHGDLAMLDIGANVQCSPKDLYDFALMGNAYARAILGRKNPAIGLLNIGSEEMKGHEDLREAAALIKSSPIKLNFKGFCEGNDICNGDFDVIVTDGFTGNVALKTAEGVSHFMYMQIKMAITSSILSKLGYLLARPGFKKMKKTLDPRRFNGAMLIGLNGIAIKSHGGSDDKGFASAIRVAHRAVESKMNDRITEELTIARQNDYEESSTTLDQLAHSS
ncbi:MAG: phosphate acyltransferase PlsX [Rickettsiales bacterium]|nr:phosphate acyltransferase PlsX [Rickettsiales bacterium]